MVVQKALDKQLSFLRQCLSLPLIWLRPVLFLGTLTPDQSCGQRAEHSTLRPAELHFLTGRLQIQPRGIVSRLFIFTVLGFHPAIWGKSCPSCCYIYESHGFVCVIPFFFFTELRTNGNAISHKIQDGKPNRGKYKYKCLNKYINNLKGTSRQGERVEESEAHNTD